MMKTTPKLLTNQKEMDNDINWVQFRADVAKIMLPIVYREVSARGRLTVTRESETVSTVVELAKLLERELKE